MERQQQEESNATTRLALALQIDRLPTDKKVDHLSKACDFALDFWVSGMQNFGPEDDYTISMREKYHQVKEALDKARIEARNKSIPNAHKAIDLPRRAPRRKSNRAKLVRKSPQ